MLLFIALEMDKMTKNIALMVLGFLSFGGLANASEQEILGNWVNQAGDGLIEIGVEQGKYIGTIVGGTDEDSDRKDSNNPDPALKVRSLLGVTIFGGFSYHENDKWAWSGGWIYDPNNGKTYKCKMRLIDNETLEIRGYIGVSLFGRTETWKKAD
jgi:uncharacterized protein (DUF2147 family)